MVFWSQRWHQKDISKLTDLYQIHHTKTRNMKWAKYVSIFSSYVVLNDNMIIFSRTFLIFFSLNTLPLSFWGNQKIHQKIRHNVVIDFSLFHFHICFYLLSANGNVKCLGKGKGRQYPPMEKISRKFLNSHYRLYNEHLLKLLKRLGYTVPNWLEQDLNDDEQN